VLNWFALPIKKDLPMKIYLLPLAFGLSILAVTSVFADSCITATCHPAIGALKNQHQPVKDGDCLSCHQQKAKEHPLKGGKSFELTAKGADLCTQCHEAMGKKKVIHQPVKDGDCLACHKVHGASGRFLLDVGEDQTGLCTGCHDSALFNQKYMHGPVAVGACTSCHTPHEGSEKALLKAPSRELCLKCHADFATAMQAAAFVHPPVKENPCTACHNPHSSAAAYILKEKMPDICVGCHATIGKKLKSAKVIHKPVGEGKLCGNCHSTHFSKAKGLLAGDEKTVCLGCHNTETLGKPPLRNIKKEIDGKKTLHGPIMNGQCGGCHDPHAANFPRILTGKYPENFYTPYTEDAYSLCLGCHDKNLLRYAETTVYTKFRNGKENLHYLHVADKRKGRSCRACHEPHGASGQKLVSQQGSMFGDWKIPIRLEITSTGGSCAPGCHRPLKYDREKPENYPREEETK
jgi:predicted CXXCH cytochrome family protein